MSQCSVPPACTGSFGKRLTSRSSTPSLSIRAAITRPPEAPRWTPATVTDLMPGPAWARVSARVLGDSSPEERCCLTRIDPDQQARRQGQVAAGQGEHGGGDML